MAFSYKIATFNIYNIMENNSYIDYDFRMGNENVRRNCV